jgi:hypothetical protein
MIKTNTIPPAVKNFRTWLRKQGQRDDEVGMLARHAAHDGTKGWPAVHYDPDYTPHSSALAAYLECQGSAALAQAARKAETEWTGLKKAQKATETPVHEAGHAVAAAILGCPIKEVNIIPEGDTLGVCCFEAEPCLYSAERIERDLIIIYAAWEAHEAYTGELGPLGTHTKDMQDAAYLFMLWDENVGFELPEQFRHWTEDYDPTYEEQVALNRILVLQEIEHKGVLFERAKSLVRENWPKVEAVAAALLKDRKLSGERVLEIVESAEEPRMAARENTQRDPTCPNHTSVQH